MTANFDWQVSASGRPPNRLPSRPYSVTTLELARGCPLRCRYEASDDFEGRSNPASRVGIALHRALQQLVNLGQGEDPVKVIRLAFEQELQAQKLAAQERPREATLQWDEGRIHAALAALINEAQRSKPREFGPIRRSGAGGASGSRTEIPVSSADGLFSGIVDRFEVRADGQTRLIDFKSAYRPDLPAQYERQVQMYAFMWRDTFGSAPDEGAVYYPLSYRQHAVDVSDRALTALETESRELVSELERGGSGGYEATPGEACKFCAFKPWCGPFWVWADARSPAERLDRMKLGVEGSVTSVLRAESTAQIVLDASRSTTVSFVVSNGRFPHLLRVRAGDRLRVLDTDVGGLRASPNLRIRPQSEVFFVE